MHERNEFFFRKRSRLEFFYVYLNAENKFMLLYITDIQMRTFHVVLFTGSSDVRRARMKRKRTFIGQM